MPTRLGRSKAYLYVESSKIKSKASSQWGEQSVTDRVHQVVVGFTAVGVSQACKIARSEILHDKIIQLLNEIPFEPCLKYRSACLQFFNRI